MLSFGKFYKRYAKRNPHTAGRALEKYKKVMELHFGVTGMDVLSGDVGRLVEGSAGVPVPTLTRAMARNRKLTGPYIASNGVASVVEQLRHYTALRSIHFSDVATNLPEIVEAVVRMPSISRLHVHNVDFDFASNLIRGLSTRLQHLSLGTLNGGTVDQKVDLIRSIGTAMPNLTSFEYASFDFRRDVSYLNQEIQALAEILQASTMGGGGSQVPVFKINSLDISNYGNHMSGAYHTAEKVQARARFVEIVLPAIAANQGIRRLNMSNYNSSFVYLRDMLRAMTNLTHLNLSGVDWGTLALTDAEGAESVLDVIKSKTSIVELDLSFTDYNYYTFQVEHDDLFNHNIAGFFRGLQIPVLNLYGSIVFPEDGIDDDNTGVIQSGIIENLNNGVIRKLQLGFVEQHNVDSFVYFVENAPLLQNLSVIVQKQRRRRRGQTGMLSAIDLIEAWESVDDGHGGTTERPIENLVIREM